MTIRNIYCVGRNYVNHIKELNNVLPDKPLIFSKPTHSIIKANNNIINLPANKGIVHYETEIVIKLAKKYSNKETLNTLVSEMTIGLDLTLRDLQQKLKNRGHPWLLSKGFPNSAILGEFTPFYKESDYKEKLFSLFINKNKVQEGKISDMIFNLQFLIDYIGNNIGLDEGDIIFTGTPAGVGTLNNDDQLSLMWGTQELGSCSITFS